MNIVDLIKNYDGKTVVDSVSFEIPKGKVILGYNLHVVAPESLTLGPRGFCVVVEEGS